VLDWLLENVATQADMQAALDQMLEKLEAIPQAEAALPGRPVAAVWPAVAPGARAVGQPPRFEATLIGSGVLAQGEGATAVGEPRCSGQR
jgi:hypothetical protein